MTATAIHVIASLGAPEVARRKWAVSPFPHRSARTRHPPYLLELPGRRNSATTPRWGAKGHDRVFGKDGALYFLMAAGNRDQLLRLRGDAPQK